MSTITAGSGDDTIFGSASNDTVKGGSGNDQITTGSGIDYAYGESGDDNINGVLDSDGTYRYWESSGKQWLYGGEGNDTIIGGTDADNILGEAGNDYVDGREGNDVISGGDGNDKLFGSEGNDSLNGGSGDDILYSGSGVDSVEGEAGDDTLHSYLETGVKTLRGGEGNDTIWGGVDDDFIYGDEGDDPWLAGYAGNDIIYGGTGIDQLYGHEGNDTLNGGAGSDWMEGGDGDDTYYIDDIWDNVYDTSGNDTLHISVDYYNVDSTIENIQYSDGVKELPYWIDALIYDESSVHRHHYEENNKTFKYLFPQQALSYFNAKDLNGWSAAGSSLEAAFLHSTSLLSNLVDINFGQTSNAYQANTIAVSTNAQTNSGGYGRNPDNSRVYNDFESSDIFMEKSNADPSITSPNYALESLVHELGHALGLKHPFSYGDADGNIPQTPYLTSSLEENLQWTTMSYTDDAKYYSASFRPLDLAALQYLYGVSPSANAGDTTFTFSKNEGTFVYDGQGADTIDATTATAAATIYLTQGDWSYIGVKSDLITASNQLTINFNTVIESVKSGSFNDTLYGNDIGNTMDGNSGSDDIYGYLGNDTISGGKGNDRLFGGEGDDILYSGSGDDSVNGGAGDDFLYGGEGNDVLYGEAGNDTTFADDGSDTITGGAGIDTIKYTLSQVNYTLAVGKTNSTIKETNTNTNDSFNTIERIVFADNAVALDIDGANSAGGIYRTYQAAFNRTPDKVGFGYWIDRADNGASAVQMAEEFVWSGEFQTLYGVTTSDNYLVGNDIEAVVDLFYQNVLGRTPDQGGLDYYASTIVAEDKTGGRVLAEIADSAENRANLLPTIESGMQYGLWVAQALLLTQTGFV